MRDRSAAIKAEGLSLPALGISPEQLCENILRGIVITDTRGFIQYVNSKFCDVTGYLPSEVIGRNPRLLQSGLQTSAFYREMWKSITATGQWQGEIRNKRKDGDIYTEWLTISSLKDASGQPAYYLGVFSDISTQKQLEQATWHEAHHDALTGLPNRLLFTAHLTQALAQARRNRSILAVMFLDLDHLKEVNDTLGHFGGDQLLLEVSHRIKSSIREGDVAARFGGDEFILMLPNISRYVDIFRVADKVVGALRIPFRIRGERVIGTASVGISVFPDDGKDVTTLINHADTAMYLAKKTGRDRFRLYLSRERRGVTARFSQTLRRWERELKRLKTWNIPSHSQ